MSAVSEAAVELRVALKRVPRMEVETDPGANLDPPSLVLGPPSLRWEDMGGGPTSATFLVYVVEKADERALERLWDLVPVVAAALDNVRDVAVIRADPGSYRELPCYEIQVEVAL